MAPTWRAKSGRYNGRGDYVFGDVTATIFRSFQIASELFSNRPTLLIGVLEAKGPPVGAKSVALRQ